MFKSSKFLISSPRLVTNLIKSVSKLPFDLDLGINVSIPLRHLSIAARFYCTEMPEKKPFSRLPTEVAPVNYALRLKPNLEAFTFEGYQEIGIEVKKPTNVIKLNCAEIQIKDASFKGNSGAVSDVTISYQEEDETATFTFPTALQAGPGTFSMNFTGCLNDKMKGFYRSKYTTPAGNETYGAVTQFEATDARRAFPCWDEPAVKATFDVTLVVPANRVALSNMPVIKETPDTDPAWKVVQYDRTPVMSTYLLAFVVGEYDYVEAMDSDGVLVRVYTPLGKKEQGQFALEVAVKTLPFYKDYFKIAYPLPKMDLIAIADFAAGAMENWGLVTYREVALLIDPKNSSSSAKQWVALVVGHELAHQWFGNLVTMEWWTHLWLNEGFASFIEYLCVDHCFPEYDIWTQFVSTDFNRAVELDALKSSHPIEVPVGHPAEVDEIFDAISYSKGASVIRMLHSYLGDEAFKKGMHQYLTKFSHKNAFTEDLWESLGAASGKPVGEMMTTWTKQMGFPVLKVSQKQEGKDRVLTITQEKFCADGSQQDSGDGSAQWMVPISITTSNPDKAVMTTMLNQKTMSVTVKDVAPTEWVKLNPGTVGFYRTQYSSDMLDALLPSIKDKSLGARDRLGLENDLFALAKAGVAPTVDVLKVIEAFENEDNYTVWSDLATNMSQLSIILQYCDFYNDFKAFGRKLFSTIKNKLGWDPKDKESHLDAMLRGLVLGRMGSYGCEHTIGEARKKLQCHVDGSACLPADLRAPTYSTCLRHGDAEVFETMLKLYRAADMQEEKVRVMRCLGTVQQEDLIKRVLEFAMSDEVRSQDTVFVIAGVTGSVLGRELAWKFVQDRWQEIHGRYKGGFLLARLVKNTTENFATEEKAKEIEAFFAANPAPAAERTVQQSCENIRLNCAWLKKDAELIKAFLQGKA